LTVFPQEVTVLNGGRGGEHGKGEGAARATERHAPFLAHVLESSPQPFAAIYPDGTLMTFNAAFCKITGYAKEELNRLVSKNSMPPGLGAVLAEVAQTVGPTGQIHQLEKTYPRKDGTQALAEIVVRPNYDSKGNLQYCYLFFIHVTQRNAMEQRLQHHADELEDAHDPFSQYTEFVTRHIRTPLRAIRNYADFLREDLWTSLNPEQRAYLDGLGRAVHEARKLLDDLLRWSEIGKGACNLETVYMGTFLRELTDSLDLPPDVDVAIQDDLPSLEAEPILLHYIFQNLICNAIKFNVSRRKLVEIGWKSLEDGSFEFFVRDNGIGIKPRYHAQIFGVFERLHTREEYPGTGIGLALAKEAVQKLGGWIHLESQPGEGSTFFVKLPGKPMQKKPEEEKTAQPLGL
jgi:PAS domain S-box-containing protein